MTAGGLASVPKLPGYCSRCDVQNPPDVSRCRCGCAVTGNALALKHGRRRRIPWLKPQETDVFRGYLSDLGGADHVTTGQVVILTRLAEAELQARGALDYMAELWASGESFTSKRMNDARGAWATATDKALRGAALLGLERVASKVPSIQDYMASKVKA